MARFVPALLVILIGFELARITWLLIPPSESLRSVPSPFVNGGDDGGPATADGDPATPLANVLESLRRFDPWGVPIEEKKPEPQPVVVEEAVISQLDLELIGTMVLPNDASWAVLVRKSGSRKQITRRVGEEVDGAILERVERNAVFFRNQSRLERITLAKIDGSGRTTTGSPAATGRSSKVKKNISRKRFKRLLDKGPGLLAGVNVSPRHRGSKLIGYGIRYAGSHTELNMLGLSSGDTIQKVNGVSVTDTQGITRLAARLKNSSSVRIDLLRGGRPHTIQIGIGR